MKLYHSHAPFHRRNPIQKSSWLIFSEKSLLSIEREVIKTRTAESLKTVEDYL